MNKNDIDADASVTLPHNNVYYMNDTVTTSGTIDANKDSNIVVGNISNTTSLNDDVRFRYFYYIG